MADAPTRGVSGDAVRAAGWGAGLDRVCRLELAAMPTAVRLARLHARDIAQGWGLGGVVDALELVVAELVTNAFRYAGSAGESACVGYPELAGVERVVLTLGVGRGMVSVLVWDADLTPPQRREPGAEEESGRGLLIIEGLGARWGFFLPGEGGKVVWAEIPLAEEPTGAGCGLVQGVAR